MAPHCRTTDEGPANLKLMAMEQQLETLNRDVRFRVSGMVTEYRGRNHLLVEEVVVVRDPP
jgi:hypothetical protein